MGRLEASSCLRRKVLIRIKLGGAVGAEREDCELVGMC